MSALSTCLALAERHSSWFKQMVLEIIRKRTWVLAFLFFLQTGLDKKDSPSLKTLKQNKPKKNGSLASTIFEGAEVKVVGGVFFLSFIYLLGFAMSVSYNRIFSCYRQTLSCMACGI